MTDDAAQKRFERLETLKGEIADAAGLQPNDQRVVMIAGLRLTHESLLAEMVASGKPADPTALTSLTKAIAELTPSPKEEPVTISVRFVQSPDTVAPIIGADGQKALLTLEQMREQARLDGRLDPRRYSYIPPPRQIDGTATEIVTPRTEVSKPSPVTSSGPAQPGPEPMTAAERASKRNAAFHSGGFATERSGGGIGRWMGAISKQRNAGTIYEPWPSPVRGQCNRRDPSRARTAHGAGIYHR